MKISAVIITYNESKNIAKCLETLKWVDEIIIIDDYSTDNTVEICKRYTDKIFLHKHQGDNWDINKNIGMDKASGDWLFLIDADELCTNELANEIKNTINSDNKYSAFWIPRKEYYFNVDLKYVFSDAKVIRLLRKGKAYFTGDHFHEHPIIDGQIGYLKNYLEHYPYKSISEYISKTNLYTDNEAKHLYSKGEKINWKKLVITPLRYFYYRYIKLKGYKDGLPGLAICLLIMIYPLLQYIKLWELHYKNK